MHPEIDTSYGEDPVGGRAWSGEWGGWGGWGVWGVWGGGGRIHGHLGDMVRYFIRRV